MIHDSLRQPAPLKNPEDILYGKFCCTKDFDGANFTASMALLTAISTFRLVIRR